MKQIPRAVEKSKAILFDADVIIHFICGDKLLDLFNIFPNKSLLIDKVYEELCKYARTKETIDNLLKLGTLEIVSFSNNLEIIKEYAHLQKFMNKGKGESACLAYCLFKKDIIASSNLNDTREYCKLHQIEYLTTMDFVLASYAKGYMTLADCETFVKKLIAKNHKLPCKSFSEYVTKFDISIAS